MAFSRLLPRLLYRNGAVFLIGLLSLLVMLVGCSVDQQQVRHQKIFRMNLGTEPPDLDPVKISDLTSFTVVQNIFRGLTLIDEHSQVLPAVAERWERSSDGLTYKFYLRKNARWSDGKPVNAQQFIDGWQRALTPNTAADYAIFLFELKNAKAFYDGKLKDFSQVGAKVIDDHTLQVTLERPIPFFPALMAAPIALPVRLDNIHQFGDRYTEAGNLVTNGPYSLVQWQHDEKILLKPDPYYFDPQTNVDAVEMLMINDANTSVVMYENNELDYIETTSSISSFDVRRLRNLPEARVFPIHRINYIGFNTQKTPFNTPVVRQAFALAMDRSFYPRLLQSGQRPITSWISPGLVGFNDTIGLHFNIEQAKAHLSKAGYPNGKGFPSVVLAYPTKYDIQKEAEIAQYLWKTYLNVDVRLENMEWKVFLNRLKNDPPDLFRLGWFVDYPDPDSFMAMMTTDSGNNYTRWNSTRYDELVKAAAVTLDNGKRQQLYDQAQQILLEDEAVMIPLYVSEKTYLLKPHIKGFKINAINLINLDTLKMASTKK